MLGEGPKRQRYDDAKPTPNVDYRTDYMTPPHSAPKISTTRNRATRKSSAPTISLALHIPRHVPNAKERRQLAARKAAANRWAPKLQNPFPISSEINKAYNLKLMRHYPAASKPANTQSVGASSAPTDSTAPSPSSSASSSDTGFVKPVIQKSTRLTKLLKTFPALQVTTVTPSAVTSRDLSREREDADILDNNSVITRTQDAERLA